MRNNIISFVLASENRKKIVQTLLKYDKRQWSCAHLEDLTKLSHATVYRTLQGLTKLGLMRTTKINRRDLIYELVSGSPYVKQIEEVFNSESTAARTVATNFSKMIAKSVSTVILYGSTAKGSCKPTSDIDILIIIPKHDRTLEENIHDAAGVFSETVNKTVSVTIMTSNELKRERKSLYIRGIKENHVILHGKTPF